MADDKIAVKPNDNLGQAPPEQATQQLQQSQVGASVQPSQRAVPGRKPLFGN